MEREKKRGQERVGSVAAKPGNLENRKKTGGKHKVYRAEVRTVQIERVCPIYRVSSEVFVISMVS